MIRHDSANDSNDSHDSPSTGGKPQTTNKLKQLDEALRVLAEFHPRKPTIEPSKPSSEPRLPSSEPRLPSSTEEAEDNSGKAMVSLRLQQVLDVFRTRHRTTPKQLARLFGIASTACEHLRNLGGWGMFAE